MNTQEALIPVHLVSGFLGSGKTTLLQRLLQHAQESGKRAAVVMNEIGEVNLDGQLVDEGIPMSEMLSGCICCTIRSDLSLEIKALVEDHKPELIFIEATGAANPLEIVDGVTEASMFAPIELRTLITVVDGPEVLKRSRQGGRTLKLMREQVRCASQLLLNKIDLLEPQDIVEVEQLIREWNAVAPLTATRSCIIDPDRLLGSSDEPLLRPALTPELEGAQGTSSPDSGHADHVHHYPGDTPHAHESHAHVMVLTHYFRGPVDSEAFEALLGRLPENVYRAKGIVTFRDTKSRYMFQFAFRESDFVPIRPQGEVHDVAVFIGEHFAKDRLKEQLEALESGAHQENNG
ncbi:CobW family GTP-binding protein [Paenibacillus daejeonensis]|uniref:CobW family GTP-binding protein n=1 Tax=Paenibacillus daejeonensis TaxID=135193 RepID=UPI0003675613|nr:GTP-binding protein [Paenibacillus daejeonensis]